MRDDMSKRTIVLLFILLFCCFAVKASADVSFINNIELHDKSITFTIHETYTFEDAVGFRADLDADDSGNVNASEVEVYRESYLLNHKAQFLEYVLIDNSSLPLEIDSTDLQFEGAEGLVDTSQLNVTTIVQYGANSTISEGNHSVWVLGHPLIDNMRFVLPAGMELVSYDGLDNASQSVQDGRVVLEGVSGIRSFMLEDKPAFEYAAYITMQKKSIYKNSFFLPLLIFIELILALAALYIYRINKINKIKKLNNSIS
jgi:Ca2+/Na+ antiporter